RTTGVSTNRGSSVIAAIASTITTAAPMTKSFSMDPTSAYRRARGRALSRNQQDLSRRLPPLERPVSLGRLRERVLMLEPQRELAVADPAEHVAGALEQVLARR